MRRAPALGGMVEGNLPCGLPCTKASAPPLQGMAARHAGGVKDTRPTGCPVGLWPLFGARALYLCQDPGEDFTLEVHAP